MAFEFYSHAIKHAPPKCIRYQDWGPPLFLMYPT